MNKKLILLFASVVLAAAVLTSAAGDALAQSYPTKYIRVFVPAPAGGGTDILARIIGQKFTESWGQQVVIENRGGASGTIAAEMAAKSAPDGYNLFMIYSAILTINPSLFKKLPYDPIKDFDPVAIFVQVPNILVVHPSVPVKSVKELIALAKSKPGQLNCASSGIGVSNYMCMELFKGMTGVDWMHIPYKGGAPAMIDLLGGQVQVMFNNLVELAPHIKAGKLRALAVATPKRISAMPDLPTVAEAGVPGYEVLLWYGMVAPAGTPKEIIKKLNAEILKIQKMSDVKERLDKMGAEPIDYPPEQMADYIKVEMAKWAKVIKDAGVKPE
ncbi:MAG: tripartite tricarboxylate transporter substrate binding protein [Deltaproteobacteria bacterium]|nr:tripartite tricarboxylate transporter substrate binding protein [Deltaproteobacteria bacterium]